MAQMEKKVRVNIPAEELAASFDASSPLNHIFYRMMWPDGTSAENLSYLQDVAKLVVIATPNLPMSRFCPGCFHNRGTFEPIYCQACVSAYQEAALHQFVAIPVSTDTAATASFIYTALQALNAGEWTPFRNAGVEFLVPNDNPNQC
jgi:hypothetical protein